MHRRSPPRLNMIRITKQSSVSKCQTTKAGLTQWNLSHSTKVTWISLNFKINVSLTWLLLDLHSILMGSMFQNQLFKIEECLLVWCLEKTSNNISLLYSWLQLTFSFNLAVTTRLKHKHILVANGLQRKKDLFEYWLVLKTPMLS